MTAKSVWPYLLLISVLVAACSSSHETKPEVVVTEEPDGNSGSDPVFDPIAVVPPFPAIVNAPVIAADEVSDQVVDKELVLGVVVNGEARAYPINMLTGPSREIINDTLGNRSIAATW